MPELRLTNSKRRGRYRYRYITKVPDFELARMIPGREEILNEGDEFETELQISASVIVQIADRGDESE